MSEIKFTPVNIAALGKEARLIASSNESWVNRYESGNKVFALKEYKPPLSLGQINLYKEATELSIPIAATFMTETPKGIIRYEINSIDFVVKSIFVERVFSVSKFMDGGRDLKDWVGYNYEGLQELSKLIMDETGFRGIQIVPYNTKRYKTESGIRCVVTDICETIGKLHKR